MKKWFTLFFIPVFPFETVDAFYHCDQCDSSYKKSAKRALLGAKKDKAQLEDDGKRMFARTLVACMCHMAGIDGHLAQEELAEINKVKDMFPQYATEMNQVSEQIFNDQNAEVTVVEMLRKASEVLTSQGIMHIIGLSARVLLADGKIDREEERLLKDYLLICGIPKSMYDVIIEKIKKEDLLPVS